MSITLQICHFSLPLSLFQLPQLLLDLRLPVFYILPFAAREQAIYMGQFCFNLLLFHLQNGDSINPPLLRRSFAFCFSLIFFSDRSVHYIVKVIKQLPVGYIASTIVI